MFRVISFLLLTLSITSFAKVVETKGPVGIYIPSNGKLKKVATSSEKSRYKMVGRTKSRRWTVVEYNGQRGYLKSNQVRVLVKKRRTLASRSSSSDYTKVTRSSEALKRPSEDSSVILDIGPAFQSSDFGIGFGGGVSFSILDRVFNSPLELAVHAYYYPSIGGISDVDTSLFGDLSVTSLAAFATLSTMILGNQRTGFGIEAGMTLNRLSVSGSSLTGGSASETNFAPLVGPIGRIGLSDSIFINAGARFQFYGNLLTQIYAGIAFGL